MAAQPSIRSSIQVTRQERRSWPICPSHRGGAPAINCSRTNLDSGIDKSYLVDNSYHSAQSFSELVSLIFGFTLHTQPAPQSFPPPTQTSSEYLLQINLPFTLLTQHTAESAPIEGIRRTQSPATPRAQRATIRSEG